MPTITIPDTITINLAQKGGAFTFNVRDMASDTLIRAMTHGFQQKVNDTMAGGLRDGYATATAQATVVIQKLAENGWGARASTGRTSDPLQAFLRREATVVATARAKRDYGKANPADVAKLRDAYLAHEGWTAKTTARYSPIDADDFDVDVADAAPAPEMALAAE